MAHVHTEDCYARNSTGSLAYTPQRSDGLDRNLRNLNRNDFREGVGHSGIILVCRGEHLRKLKTIECSVCGCVAHLETDPEERPGHYSSVTCLCKDSV